MNHKIKRLWCAALRGGTWEQVRIVMVVTNTNQRCALGVLLEVAREHGDKELTGAVLFNSLHPGLPTLAARATIAALNDRSRYSFEQIATFIEEKL